MILLRSKMDRRTLVRLALVTVRLDSSTWRWSSFRSAEISSHFSLGTFRLRTITIGKYLAGIALNNLGSNLDAIRACSNSKCGAKSGGQLWTVRTDQSRIGTDG